MTRCFDAAEYWLLTVRPEVPDHARASSGSIPCDILKAVIGDNPKFLNWTEQSLVCSPAERAARSFAPGRSLGRTTNPDCSVDWFSLEVVVVDFTIAAICPELDILTQDNAELAVARGEQEPDDRDAMAFQKLLGPEDLFAERTRRAKHIVRNTLKGSDGRLYTKVLNARTGELETKSAQDLADITLGFAGSLRSGAPYVAALQNSRIRMLPRDKVDFELPDTESSFSHIGNLIPFKSMVKGQRSVMGSRFLTQAMPLQNAEAPLVQSGVPETPGTSFEQLYGTHMGALRSPQAGVVTKVSPDAIEVRYQDGSKETHELYNNMPFNRKTLYHQTPVVRPGQVFDKDALLARSNFTDQEGTTALGMNARVAYLPDEGYNYEDAISISESFARRMQSEHMYQHEHEWEPGDHQGKKAFVSMFPSEYTRKQLENFDDNGVVKPGTTLRYGDPLILIASERERNRKSLVRSRTTFRNNSKTWDHHSPGVVTDVVDTAKGPAVVVAAMNSDAVVQDA